jgi:2-amino-4-hydroxy-6-hydroxymethyldihydropteridine diphosphokinase
MVIAYIGLGANLADPLAQLQRALLALKQLPETTLLRSSRFYRSAPLQASGPEFINAVAQLQTELSPLALLHALQTIEQTAGRQRPYHHAPRTLDLDLLFHGDTVLQTPELTLPHPRWRERAFVLRPLAELAPDWVRADDLAAVAQQALSVLPD